MAIKLDWHVDSLEEREKIVNEILETYPEKELTPKALDTLSNYLVFLMSTKEMKKHMINTPNRMVTINRYETSFEGLCGKLENGENGLYNLISDLGKHTRLIQNDPITKEDVSSVCGLKDLQAVIAKIEKAYNEEPPGPKKYLLKSQLIQLRQDQYVLRDNPTYLNSSNPKARIKSLMSAELYDDIVFDECGNPVNRGPISLFNEIHIRELLNIYGELKQDLYDKQQHDGWAMLIDLDRLIDDALQEKHPIYYDLLIYKIDKITHADIQQKLKADYGVNYSIEQISNIWRKKIPKLIADKAQENYIIWYYTFVEYGKWKKCNRCGEIKLAHNRFYSRNKTSKDGFYSLCKKCRNEKARAVNDRKDIIKKIADKEVK